MRRLHLLQGKLRPTSFLEVSGRLIHLFSEVTKNRERSLFEVI